MDNKERRRHSRYEAFIPVTLSLPASLGKNELKIPCWIKDISMEGMAVEACDLDPVEIKRLLEAAENKQFVIALISLPGNMCINAECKVTWETPAQNKQFYRIGLQLLKMNPLRRDIWKSFVESLSPK